MRLIELNTLDLIYKGEHIATIGMLSISRVAFRITTQPNTPLRRLVQEINLIKRRQDREADR